MDRTRDGAEELRTPAADSATESQRPEAAPVSGSTAVAAPRTRREALGKEPRRREPKRRGGLVGYLREIGIVLVAAILLSWIVKTFLIQPFWIPTGSMENTLGIGDRVMVSKLTPGVFDLKRGDVVVFKDPGNWLEGYSTPPKKSNTPRWLEAPLAFVGLAPETSEKYLIKRVIGLPGDKIDGVAGQPLKINGQPIDEPYLAPDSRPTEMEFHITVPAGRVWVMGDHRAESGDSRWHDNNSGGRLGSIPVDDIVGRAILVVWPMSNGKWVDNYQAVFASVPPPAAPAAP